MEQIDPQVKALTTAIGQAETGDDPNAYSQPGASGEYGRYQFTEPTWRGYAKEILGDENADITSKENQNKVAYGKIKQWKEAGYNPAQIASMWNAGSSKPNAYKENHRGVNKYGVQYDTPAYAQRVSDYYRKAAQSTKQYNVDYTGQTNEQPVQDIASKREQLKLAGEPVSVNPQKAEPTLLGKAIRSIARLPMRGLATLGGLETSIADFITGKQGDEGLTKGVEEGTTFGSDYLGKVYPIGFGQTKEGKNFNALNAPGRSLADSAGFGAEAASYLVGGPATGSLAKGLGKESLKQLLKRGAIEGAGIGATGGLGAGLQNAAGESTVGQGIKDVVAGTAGGAVTGGLIGGSVPILARGGLSAADATLSRLAPESSMAKKAASALDEVKGVAQKEKQAAEDSALDDIIFGDKKSPEFIKRKVEEGNVDTTSGKFGFNPEEMAQKKILTDLKEAGTYTPDAPTDVQVKQILEARNSSKNLEQAKSLDAIYEKLKEKLVQEILTGNIGKKTILKTAKNYAKNKAKNYLLSKTGLGGAGLSAYSAYNLYKDIKGRN